MTVPTFRSAYCVAMSPEEPEGEVIIFYTLEPDQPQQPLHTCQFCSKEFKTEAKKKHHISKYHVLLRYRTGSKRLGGT